MVELVKDHHDQLVLLPIGLFPFSKSESDGFCNISAFSETYIRVMWLDTGLVRQCVRSGRVIVVW